MKFPTVLVVVCGIFFYLVAPILIFKFKQKKIRNICIFSYVIIFLLVLLAGVWGKLDIGKTWITVNFDFTHAWCAKTVKWSFLHLTIFDVIINLLMLIPIGTMFTLCHKQKLCKILITGFLIGFSIGVFIELTQLVLPVYRSVQLSDVIFNAISVLLGAMYGYLIQSFNKL